jgi:hypothetical protein
VDQAAAGYDEDDAETLPLAAVQPASSMMALPPVQSSMQQVLQQLMTHQQSALPSLALFGGGSAAAAVAPTVPSAMQQDLQQPMTHQQSALPSVALSGGGSATYPPGTVIIGDVAWLGGKGGCGNIKCAVIPLLVRKNHRTNCPNVGLHLGCCGGFPGIAGGIGPKVGKTKQGGHSPDCATTAGALAADEAGKIFGVAVPNQGVTGTTTANGRHVPESWFQRFCDWADSIESGLVEAAITEERKGDKQFKHLHWWLEGHIGEQHYGELKIILKNMWGIGNGPGQLNGKIMIKKVTDRRGWLSTTSPSPQCTSSSVFWNLASSKTCINDIRPPGSVRGTCMSGSSNLHKYSRGSNNRTRPRQSRS